jgi:hypothetical protein
MPQRVRVSWIENAKVLFALTRRPRLSSTARTIEAMTGAYRATLATAMGGRTAEPEFSRQYEAARERYVRTGDPAALDEMTRMMVCTCGHPEYIGIDHSLKGCTTAWW